MQYSPRSSKFTFAYSEQIAFQISYTAASSMHKDKSTLIPFCNTL